jgi:ABC-type transporter MlaC component
MHILSRLCKLAFVLAAFGAFTSLASGQDAKSQIRTEIDRLATSLKEKPITDPDYAPLSTIVSQSLQSAAAALDSGKLYMSLEQLLQAEDFLQGARFPVEKAEAVKSGLPAFEAEWKKVSQILTAYDREVRQKDWGSSPAAVRALSETALGRSVPLLKGGRGFAISTKPGDGLLYLGQAQGEAAFARFSATLALRRNSATFPLRSFLPELRKLQEKTNTAFVPPRSIQLHDRFIALNSTLKLAEELDAQKFYAGSLYQYLEATRHFAMLDAPPVEAARQSALKDAVAAALKKLADSKQDDSIAQLFLERATSQTAHADGSASTADEWRSAQVILEQVIPAYREAQKPAAPLQLASGKAVQLTLVRWPYT